MNDLSTLLLTSSNSRSAGGLFATVSSLSKALVAAGERVAVLSYDDDFSAADRMAYGDVPMHKYTCSRFPVLKQLGFSKDIHKAIEELSPSVIHLQGLWMYHSNAARLYRRKHPDVKLIIEPHGMLDAWALKNSGWKKRVVGVWYENENLATADCIHALCEEEYKSVRAFGLKNPVAIIPNGIDLPVNPPERHAQDKKILLYIGRLHPKKGLEGLIRALGRMKTEASGFFSEWTVRIAGWDQGGHEGYLRQLAGELGLGEDVSFIGSVYGELKTRELANATAFVLPSFSEGLPMSVLEAWAFRLPVVMTDYCNLPEGFTADAAIHTMPTPDGIFKSLCVLRDCRTDRLIEMGENGYELVRRNFTWECVAQKTSLLYAWLRNGGEAPGFVRLT